MPTKFERATERFRVYGIDLNNPVDSVKPGYYPILENVRSYTDGVIEPRQGLSLIATVSSTNKTPVHSVRRLNDPNSGNWIRVVGIQDTISFMNSTSTSNTFTRAQYNSADITVSGNPLALVPWRPDQSPSSWMYIGDSTAMRKLIGYNAQTITRGTAHQIGIAPPANPPTVEAAPFINGNQGLRFDSLGTSPNNWAHDRTVFTTTPALVNRIPTAQTVTAVLYDSGSSGWCSLVLPAATMAVLGVGAHFFVVLAGPDPDLTVHEIYTGSSTTTVGSIIYDNSPANTGTCIIQPASSLKEIERNAVVLLNAATYARVTDIIDNPDGTFAFKCSTGAATITAAQSLAVVPSVRVYDWIGGIAAGNGIGDALAAAGNPGAIYSTGAGTATEKTGWIQQVTALDLNVFSSTGAASGYQTSDDTYVHLSFLMSDLSKLSQGRIMLDIDNTSLNISSSTDATPIVITTATDHELATGDSVYITGHTVNTNANGNWTITVVTPTTFSLTGSTLTGAGAGGATGTVWPLFKKNFYYRAFSPNDLINAVKGDQTALDNRSTIIQRRQLTPAERAQAIVTSRKRINISKLPGEGFDPPPEVEPFDPSQPGIDTNPTTQTGTGDYQWNELIFKRGQFEKAGTGNNRGYSNVRAWRLELTMLDTTAVTVRINSFTLWGNGKLDVSELAIPYEYRYRYRVANTGARSNWSPGSRSGVIVRSSSVNVTVAAPSGAPEVDKIDIQRKGGVSTNWLDVGTTATGSLTFTDGVSDLFALGSAPFAEDDTNYQPWPVVDVPFSTTATSVTGSYIVVSAALPTSLAKGTPMKVNGVDTTFRRTVSAGALIYEVEDSLGTLTNVTVEIPAPVKYGQPLPTLWLHNGRTYAVGDTKNPGTLYYSNGNDPDGTTELNKLEVTATSEPLQNGCSFNGKNYVWSSERMFELDEYLPGFVRALDIPGSKGMFSRWGLAVGERIWFLSKDGIYQTGGGESVSITDETLRPFFVKEGNSGAAVNGFNPPDWAQTAKFRLSYYDGYLYFVYQDTGGNLRCMVYTVRNEKPGWWPDTHLSGRGITYFYGEEGSGVHSLLGGGNDATTANLYQVSGTADNATGITGRIRTQAFDGQDRRALKYFGDLIVDADSQGATMTTAVYINNYSTTAAISPTNLSTSTAGRTQTIIDTSSGVGFEARNAALDVTWTSTGLTPKLYMWEPSYLVLPETSKLRASYWDDCGVQGDKFFQGIKITTDTQNVARTVRIEYDGGNGVGTLADTLTIQHAGNIQKEYVFSPAFTGHQVRIRPTDSGEWKNFQYEWVFQPEPPKVSRWETQQTSHGYDGFVHLRGFQIFNVSSTGAVTLTITRTDDNTSASYTIPTTTGVKKKVLVPIAVHKGKSFIYTLTATGDGFRLYKDTTDLYVKGWGSNSAYASRNPFGHTHGDGKATI